VENFEGEAASDGCKVGTVAQRSAASQRGPAGCR